ncbi:MAG TPA: hypothetical protein VNT28_02925 [Candidatus Limnocylindrales bacterium]|jgi:hypothetical protein|nr:hypothetical protein [Candidatus Limnocylindrales bacterium]
MTEGSRPSENPRSPEHHDLTGAGTPRSADEGLPAEGAPADSADSQVDASVTTGMRSTSQPAQADEVRPNRSGSGGSGGPSTPDPSVEGSTGSSMSELLAGEDDEERQPR